MKALTQDELTRLLDGIRGTEFHAMCLLGYWHGMRVSEICGLKRADVTENRITVRRLKHSQTNVQPLNDAEKEALAGLPDYGEYVFKMRSRKTFYRYFRKACLSVGIAPEKAHPHVLKHSLGYALAKANVTLPVIQKALGHRNIQNTAIYTELDDETVGKMVQEALT